MDESRISLEDALQAQGALRAAAGLKPEEFPMPAFVGMISDEIEQLRKMGRNDQEIADLISANSSIKITGEQVAHFYAPPESRQQPAEK